MPVVSIIDYVDTNRLWGPLRYRDDARWWPPPPPPITTPSFLSFFLICDALIEDKVQLYGGFQACGDKNHWTDVRCMYIYSKSFSVRAVCVRFAATKVACGASTYPADATRNTWPARAQCAVKVQQQLSALELGNGRTMHQLCVNSTLHAATVNQAMSRPLSYVE